MIVVHHLIVGRSVFTVWLLEELGLEYELVQYHRNPQTRRAPPELKEVHPLGKSPVIVDDGMVIGESGAIASYLLERYDSENRLAPSRDDVAAWAEFTQWLHYAEGSAALPLMMTMLGQVSQEPLPQLVQGFAAGEVALHLSYIEQCLGEQDYILGEFSAADIGLGYIASLAQRLEVVAPYPKVDAYAERVRARPAFERATERSGG